MEQLVEHIIPSLRIIEIAGNVKQYEQWLKDYHNRTIDKQLLAGYKFFLECAFHEFYYGVSVENEFDIKDDFLFKCAMGKSSYPIDKLPNTCERTIFLKNIYKYFKPVLRAKSINGIENKLQLFYQEVGVLFENVFLEQFCISTEYGVNEDEAIRLILVENLYIYFTQINNNGPYAYMASLLRDFWISNEKKTYCFEGYKFILQYLWYNVLDKFPFEKAKLNTLHLADSWREYSYKKLPPDASIYDKMFNTYFDLGKQNSLDSFFYQIKYNITDPFEEETGINITSVHKFFGRTKVNYSKNVFNKLLCTDELIDPYDKLDDDDKISIALYWYPLEVFEPGSMHNGITAFITSMAGTVSLSNSEGKREFEKVIVCKFIHPLTDKKNDYSYGVLLDSMAAAGHYYSGWLLYYDCCGDYSGFSGSEHKKAEKLIDKYVNNNQVELRELEVDKKVFRRYVAEHIYSSDELSNEKIIEVEERLLEQSKKQKIKVDDVIGKSKAVILELLMCYILSKHGDVKSIKWSANKNEGEIDLLLEYSDKIKIIECKVNPNNYDLREENRKLVNKLKEYKLTNKEAEFWFWEKPSIKNVEWLQKNSVSYNYINQNEKIPDIINGVDLDIIKFIMKYNF